MNNLEITLTGIAPMLMHSDKLANPMDKATIAHKEVSKKRAKTPEDLQFLARSEWEHSIYRSAANNHIVMPSLNIRAALIDGAKLNKLGMAIKRGVFFNLGDNFLQFDGPQDSDKLWKSGKFTDVRAVRVSTAKLMRHRPKFDDWSVTITVSYDPEIISAHDLKMCFDNAGMYSGLGDFRPLFGRFECSYK